jgi:hypothetical protein
MTASSRLKVPGLPADLSQPALRALTGAGIHRLADVAPWTERDLAALHGVGPKAIRSLRAALAERGLSFRDG